VYRKYDLSLGKLYSELIFFVQNQLNFKQKFFFFCILKRKKSKDILEISLM